MTGQNKRRCLVGKHTLDTSKRPKCAEERKCANALEPRKSEGVQTRPLLVEALPARCADRFFRYLVRLGM